MTIENNNPEKPKMLCYMLFYSHSDTTYFVKDKDDKPTNAGVKTNYYTLSTNDFIPEDKFEEIKIAIHKILNQ